jgi:hypothetical protein
MNAALSSNHVLEQEGNPANRGVVAREAIARTSGYPGRVSRQLRPIPF